MAWIPCNMRNNWIWHQKPLQVLTDYTSHVYVSYCMACGLVFQEIPQSLLLLPVHYILGLSWYSCIWMTGVSVVRKVAVPAFTMINITYLSSIHIHVLCTYYLFHVTMFLSRKKANIIHLRYTHMLSGSSPELYASSDIQMRFLFRLKQIPCFRMCPWHYNIDLAWS